MSGGGKKLVSKRNIPEMEIIEDVESWLKNDVSSGAVEDGVRKLEEAYRRYKFMEQSLTTQRVALRERLPDLENSLELLAVLEAKNAAGEPLATTAQISDDVATLFRVEDTSTVLLWLGAGIMVEIPLAEARKLLEDNRNGVTSSLEELDNELDFVKQQATTNELNVATVYNYGIRKRKALQQQQQQQQPSAAAS